MLCVLPFKLLWCSGQSWSPLEASTRIRIPLGAPLLLSKSGQSTLCPVDRMHRSTHHPSVSMPSYHVLTYDPQRDSTWDPSDIVVISSDHPLKRRGYIIIHGTFHWMRTSHVRIHNLEFPNWERYVFLMNWKFRLDWNPYPHIYVKSWVKERIPMAWRHGVQLMMVRVLLS